MTQLQYQEQEDLLADFNLPAHKDRNSSIKDIHSRDSFDNESCTGKSGFIQPESNSNAFSSIQARETTKKPTYDNNCTEKVGESFVSLAEQMNLLSGIVAFDIGLESLTNAAHEFSAIALLVMWKILYEFPKYEEEYRLFASVALISYGGSWPSVAGIIAAIEVFGTRKVVEEALAVGRLFFCCDFEEDGVSPAQVKGIFRKLGLHIAQLIAVLISPSWAEICIAFAFGSKFTCLVPVQEYLAKTVSKPVAAVGEYDDSFSGVDTSWVELLASTVCIILSFILFGCFPRLITAMYMGYLGVSLIMESLVDFTFVSLLGDFDIAYESLSMKKSTQYVAWGIVAFMAIWQAVSEYAGFFLYLSWPMFLYPIAKFYNLFITDIDYDECKSKKAD